MKLVSPDTFLRLPPKLRLYVARFELSSIAFFAMIVDKRQMERCEQVTESQIPFGVAAGQQTAPVLSCRYAKIRKSDQRLWFSGTSDQPSRSSTLKERLGIVADVRVLPRFIRWTFWYFPFFGCE